MVNENFSPVETPNAYRQEFLKTVLFFLMVMPLVELGLVNLIPDPCCDVHLRDQMFHMTKSRSAGMHIDRRNEPRIEQLMKQDFQRGIISLPREALRSQLLQAFSKLDPARQEETLSYMEQLKENDPLAVLQEDSLAGGEGGGQFNMMQLVPNFEIAMYLAQATGSCIVTDSPFRWTEVKRAIRQRAGGPLGRGRCSGLVTR